MLTQPKMLIKPNAWRWVKLARYIQTDKAVQHHVLLALVQYADLKGECFPSYERLMLDTRIKSKSTISSALRYLRDALKVVRWTPGHGNQFQHVHNRYQFDAAEMVKILKKQKADEPKREEGDTPPEDEPQS